MIGVTIANEYVNKVIYGGTTLIDLTSDTITAADVINEKTFHLKDGSTATGSCTYDADTSDATALAGEILATKTAYVSGNKITGSMTNRGGVTGTITTVAGQYSIAQGYHDGSGKVSISATEQAKLIATNIRQGVTILGVLGTMSPEEGMELQSKSITPTVAAQTLLPDTGYDGMSQVNVAAIPYAETDNAAGGKTVTIAGA